MDVNLTMTLISYYTRTTNRSVPSNVFMSCFYKYLAAAAAASPPKNAEQIT